MNSPLLITSYGWIVGQTVFDQLVWEKEKLFVQIRIDLVLHQLIYSALELNLFFDESMRGQWYNDVQQILTNNIFLILNSKFFSFLRAFTSPKLKITVCIIYIYIFRARCNMHQVGFGRERKVFSMNEMNVEPPIPCDYISSRNGYCKRVITSTAEIKITNFSKNEDERTM